MRSHNGLVEWIILDVFFVQYDKILSIDQYYQRYQISELTCIIPTYHTLVIFLKDVLHIICYERN